MSGEAVWQSDTAVWGTGHDSGQAVWDPVEADLESGFGESGETVSGEAV